MADLDRSKKGPRRWHFINFLPHSRSLVVVFSRGQILPGSPDASKDEELVLVDAETARRRTFGAKDFQEPVAAVLLLLPAILRSQLSRYSAYV